MSGPTEARRRAEERASAEARRPMEAQRPTEVEIRRKVHTFYARVRDDDLLGPVFEERIGTDWDAHLDRMVDFWSTVLLASGRYRGDPI